MQSNLFLNNVKKIFEKEIPESEIFVFENIDSTNNYAKEYARSSENKKSAFFIAQMQSGGRGSKGRSFSSVDGGLYMSFLLYPELKVADAVKLTCFAAVALVETICEFTQSSPRIKWVNDIYIGNKKVAGILTEGAFSENGNFFDYAVVGIGVNLKKRSFDNELLNIATDIESETGVVIDIPSFAVSFAKKLSSFEESCVCEYMEKYKALSLLINKRIKVVAAENIRYGKALSVNDDGTLRVLFDDGEVTNLSSADVSVLAT